MKGLEEYERDDDSCRDKWRVNAVLDFETEAEARAAFEQMKANPSTGSAELHEPYKVMTEREKAEAKRPAEASRRVRALGARTRGVSLMPSSILSKASFELAAVWVVGLYLSYAVSLGFETHPDQSTFSLIVVAGTVVYLLLRLERS